MRPATNFTLHAILAAAIAALATTSAAAQSPPTLRIETETPMAAKGDKPRIAVLELKEFRWGTTEQARTFVKSWSTSGDADDRPSEGRADKDMTLKGKTIGENAKDGAKGGNVEFEWKVEEGESAPPPPRGGVSVAAGDVDGDGATSSGRQHKPLRITKEWDATSPQLAKPLAKGSVWVRVATPWAGCRVGARYPTLELGEGTKRYVLQDATVASCGQGAGDRPTEEVAFYYNKIAFNYASTSDKR
jgi:type VI protein secretion system component Hcp